MQTELKNILEAGNFKKSSWKAISDFAYDYFQQHPEIGQFNDAPEVIVTITKDSFKEEYSELTRSYRFILSQKYFLPGMGGNSIFAHCLDGSEMGIRLDYYLFNSWKIENVYMQSTYKRD